MQRFTIFATKPNLVIDKHKMNSEKREVRDSFPAGWAISSDDPEAIVISFSSLRIKKDYKLCGYQFSEGRNGNGVVWAIPEDRELPRPEECVPDIHSLLHIPKPDFALSNYMSAIEGDQTPLSYLQASIVSHELHEFGARWHGIRWGRDVILPLSDELTVNNMMS